MLQSVKTGLKDLTNVARISILLHPGIFF